MAGEKQDNVWPLPKFFFTVDLGDVGKDLPFQEVSARLLGVEPDEEALRAFAHANPEKWTKMLRDTAALAGYKDGIEIDLHGELTITVPKTEQDQPQKIEIG